MPESPVSPAAPSVTYGSYLALETLLDCQRPRSALHDEMLFVIMHQTKELWLKQMLHEIGAAITAISGGDLAPAFKALARVSRIQTVMTLSWEVLATMTPADYAGFRSVLGSSSGFQSFQFRQLEFRLGLKDPAHLAHQAPGSPERAALEAALAAPSLREAANARLAPAGLLPAGEGAGAGAEVLIAGWLAVYRDTGRHWDLYELAEKLVDLDDALTAWRQKHVLTVERIIGRKRGTGGTEGVGYLEATLRKRCFPELWEVRTRL